MNYPNSQHLRRLSTASVVALAVCSSVVIAGCKDQVSDDTAAIRAILESKKSDEALQKKRAADEFAAGKAALAKE